MIKKSVVLLTALIFGLGAFTFPACGNEKQLSPEYEDGADVRFIDPCGTFYVNTDSGYRTEYNGVAYKFAQKLTEEERNKAVAETAACFELLEKKVGALEENYTVYVVDDCYVPYVDENNLYFGYKNIRTAEFATAVVQLVYGRGVNYGVLYGLGATIAKERGYNNETEESDDAISLYETAPEYLDLNYACFLDNYADAETQAKVKTLSVEFYKFLEANGKTDLLTEYSDAKRRNYFNEFLSANGKGEYNSDSLDGISFYGGGNTLRLMWESEYAKYNLYDDYKDYCQNGSLGEDPLNCGYTDLRKHIVNLEAQMLYIRERLAEYNDSPKKVTVNFNFTGHNYSYYDITFHSLNLCSVSLLKHEYTHSIINKKYGYSSGTNSIIIHSLVYYFERYPVDEQLSYTALYIQDGIKNADESDTDYIKFLSGLENRLGHEINLFDVNDFMAYFDCYAAYLGADNFIESDNPSYAYVSLANYLISNFGEKKVCRAAFLSTPEKVLGKPWYKIISEWRTYLEENCNLGI